MENFKKCFILMRHEVQVSTEHSSKTLEDKELIKNIPYDSVVGSIMYAMLVQD